MTGVGMVDFTAAKKSFYFGYDGRGLLNRRTSPWRESRVTQRDARGNALKSECKVIGGGEIFTEELDWTNRSQISRHRSTYLANQSASPAVQDVSFRYFAGGQLKDEIRGAIASESTVPRWNYYYDQASVLLNTAPPDITPVQEKPTLGVRSAAAHRSAANSGEVLSIGANFLDRRVPGAALTNGGGRIVIARFSSAVVTGLKQVPSTGPDSRHCGTSARSIRSPQP